VRTRALAQLGAKRTACVMMDVAQSVSDMKIEACMTCMATTCQFMYIEFKVCAIYWMDNLYWPCQTQIGRCRGLLLAPLP